MTEPTHPLRVRALTWEAEGILGLELVPVQTDTVLPAFTAGAHIDLQLPAGMSRSYSLLNDQGERHRYCIAVNKDAASRGGSRHLHEAVRPGDVLPVTAPRNHFALDEGDYPTVLIAGGIGITPLLCMVRRLAALQRPWALHYAARSRRHAAFVEALRDLAHASGGRLHLHWDDEQQGRVLDVAGIVAALPPGAHVYACGPAPLLKAYEAATAGLPGERVHVEHFSSTQAAATAGGYEVLLRRSGQRLQLQAGQSILDAVLAAGVDALYSCREGICGTCEVAVLAGVPDHRDNVLSAAERAANTRMLICCSGALSPTLELDL